MIITRGEAEIQRTAGTGREEDTKCNNVLCNNTM